MLSSIEKHTPSIPKDNETCYILCMKNIVHGIYAKISIANRNVTLVSFHSLDDFKAKISSAILSTALNRKHITPCNWYLL